MRTVRCANDTVGKLDVVDDFYCAPDERPTNITNCSQQRCPEWNYGAWGECTTECRRNRLVICQDDKRKVDSTKCLLETEPRNTETCCHFKWRNMWTPVIQPN